MESKISEYKANLASREQELADSRRNARDEEKEISRLRGISEQDKEAAKQMTAELQSAQAEAAASAAKSGSVGQALEQARAQMQKEEVDIKQVLLQRQNTEDSMESKISEYKAKLAASQNATIFANAKTADLAMKLDRLSGVSMRETEVSKRLTGSLQHAQAAAAAALANASTVAKQRDAFVQQVQQLKTMLVQRTEQVEDAQDLAESAKRSSASEVQQLRQEVSDARAAAAKSAREVTAAERRAQDAGARLQTAEEAVASSKAAAAQSAKREEAAKKERAAWQAKAEQAKANLIAAMQEAETAQDRQAKLSDELRAAAAATANKTREVTRLTASLRRVEAEAGSAADSAREANAAVQAEKQHRAAAEKAQKAAEDKAKHLKSERDLMEQRGRELASQLQDAMDKQEDTQVAIATARKNVSAQAAAVAAAKAKVAQAEAERQQMQERLSDETVQLNAEKQQVAKTDAESKLVRGLAASSRKERQDATNRADALAAQVAALQATVAAAKRNETKLLHQEQEMQSEKQATLADSDQFFETAAKMQNSNDELKQELATEKQNEATLRSKVTELTQNLESQNTANKFQEQQLLDRLAAKTAKLGKDEAILKRFRAQVQQMADAQKAQAMQKAQKALLSKAGGKPSVKKNAAKEKKAEKKAAKNAAAKNPAAKNAVPKNAAKEKKAAVKNVAPKVQHEASKQSTKSTRLTMAPAAKFSLISAETAPASKLAANATKRLRGSA